MKSKGRTFRQILALGAFCAWVPAIAVPGVYFLGSHLLTLPKPSLADSAVEASIAGMRLPGDRGKWLAVHVLYADCPCSLRILTHLLDRGAVVDSVRALKPGAPGITEKILFVGDNPAAHDRIAAAGFTLETVLPEELKTRYHVESVPLLILADDKDAIRYIGGYTSSKQGPDIEDLEIIAKARSGDDAAPLPVFGCPVSQRLQAIVDPLGLK